MSLEARIRRRLEGLPERSFWGLSSSTPDFISNDYLGLIHDGIVQEILRQAPPELYRGSGASRYLGGDAAAFHEVEELAQALWGKAGEKALFFPSGLTANLAFWSSLLTREDVVIFDREVHASIRYGIHLSGARAWGFSHNCWEEAEKKIKQAPTPPFLVIESLYSMRGTSPDIEALKALSQRYEFYLVIDEAHTTLILPQGTSWSSKVGLEPIARLFTFGKAAGLLGAVWIGASWLIDYIQRRGFAGIYTTALPPFIAWAIARVLQRNEEWESRRQKLWNLIYEARTLFQANGIAYQGLDGPIALLPVGSYAFPLKVLYPPTVSAPACRLSLHAHNSLEELYALIS